MNKEKNNSISSILINWYQQNKRDLPWRETSDPYLIWISEIILQQTRVAQGLNYYLRFVGRFPDVKSLAEADEDEVLTFWQGLGYYSRARNLHFAAKTIVSSFSGCFPRNHDDVVSLKGVGGYTAAAIVSFAYGEPYAVLDGNVYRVLSRLFAVDEPIDTGSGKKIFSQLAQELLDEQNPGIYNQAIMEFGALQCVPSKPDCAVCPLQHSCLALEKGVIGQFPKKRGKTKVQNRYFNYFDVRVGNSTLLKKRIEDDIWKNLYELPLIETSENVLLEEIIQNQVFIEMFPEKKSIKIQGVPVEFKHILSHRIIYAKFYRIDVDTIPLKLLTECRQIQLEELPNYAISRLVSKYFEKNRSKRVH
jgi:A/G-specific adenine glycosylase